MDGLVDNVKKEISVVDGLIEVSHAPTGCMLIKRQVFDKMIKAYPNDFIDQPTIVNGEAKTNPYMYNFFDIFNILPKIPIDQEELRQKYFVLQK